MKDEANIAHTATDVERASSLSNFQRKIRFTGSAITTETVVASFNVPLWQIQRRFYIAAVGGVGFIRCLRNLHPVYTLPIAQPSNFSLGVTPPDFGQPSLPTATFTISGGTNLVVTNPPVEDSLLFNSASDFIITAHAFRARVLCDTVQFVLNRFDGLSNSGYAIHSECDEIFFLAGRL